MKRILVILSLVLLFLPSNLIYSESIQSLSKSVVFIREQKPYVEYKGNKKYEVWLKRPGEEKFEQKLISNSGTGFLVEYQGKILLVTAAHVIKGMSKNAEILWNTASGKVKHFTFKQLQKGIEGSKWFIHPRADIAVHPFGVTEKADHVVVSQKLYWDNPSGDLLGTKVYIFGFPLNLGVKEVLSPISKKAELASSLTTIDAPNISPDVKFLLLDEDLATGYSGAPVFTSPEPRMKKDAIVVGGEKLIGVQSMTISDRTGGKLSLIVPISYLKEILHSDEFKAFQDQYERMKQR